MANFKAVNKAVRALYPSLDIEVVRGDGYVYFSGGDGFGLVSSVWAHPTSTSTEDLIELCHRAIAEVHGGEAGL